MSESIYKKRMTESYFYEASQDDEDYVHIGYGKYKDKDHVDDPTAPTFKKDDSGAFLSAKGADKEKSKGDEEKPKDEPKKPMAISQTGGLGGDTGTDADVQSEPPEGAREPEDVEDEDDEEPSGEKDESIKVINGRKYRAIQESVNKRIFVKEVYRWLKSLEEYRYRKVPGVDARRITSFVNNGLNETDLPISLQKKWESAKYSKEKTLADRFIKQRISKKLTQTESKHPLKERYDRLFTNKVVL